jgi:hypothetical protein
MTTILQATTTSHVRWAFRSEAVSHELRSNHILIWWQHDCHGEILRYGGQECSLDVVFFPSPENNYVMEKVEGHDGNWLPGFLDKASNRPSLVPVYARLRRVLAGICPKISMTQSPGANDAK